MYIVRYMENKSNTRHLPAHNNSQYLLRHPLRLLRRDLRYLYASNIALKSEHRSTYPLLLNVELPEMQWPPFSDYTRVVHLLDKLQKYRSYFMLFLYETIFAELIKVRNKIVLNIRGRTICRKSNKTEVFKFEKRY